jgi:hypothetical protein
VDRPKPNESAHAPTRNHDDGVTEEVEQESRFFSVAECGSQEAALAAAAEWRAAALRSKN